MKVGDEVIVVGDCCYHGTPIGYETKIVKGSSDSWGIVRPDGEIRLACNSDIKLKKEDKMDYLKDEETVQAIKDSVRHWEENVERAKNGQQLKMGGEFCKLCTKFHVGVYSCPSCPLFLRGMQCEKHEQNPYEKVKNHPTVENAQNMVLALKSLFYPEEPRKEEVFYHRGQRFIEVEDGIEYILTTAGDTKYMQLTALDDGDVYSESSVLVGNVNKITEKEFNQICEYDTFKLK